MGLCFFFYYQKKKMKMIKKEKVVIQSQIKSGAKLKTEKGEENEKKHFVYGVFGHEALLTTSTHERHGWQQSVWASGAEVVDRVSNDCEQGEGLI